MATEWTTLLDWQPDPTQPLNANVIVEAPMALSPALTIADDNSLLVVDCQVSRGTVGYQAEDDIIWSSFPTIRAGDYRAAANATGTRVANLSTAWGEVGVISPEGQGRRLVFGKGQNGRPALLMIASSEGLQRMRIRLLSLPSPAPAPVTPPPPPSATTAPAPTPVPTPAPRDGAIRSLAVTNDPNQRLLTQIGSIIIAIDLRWDDLSGYWYLGAEQNGRPLIAGRRVTPGLRLLPPLTGWQLVAAPLSDELVSVGRNAWGQTHVLLYVGDGAGVSWLR